MKISRIFKKFLKIEEESECDLKSSKALLIFEHTSEVIKAEEIIKNQNIFFKVVAPPPEYRKGCDLAIEVWIVEIPGILNLLKKKGLDPIEVLPLSDTNLEPVDLYFIKDYGDFIMVRFANMKITAEKKNLKIVNISGGGCPDVPFLAAYLIGRDLKGEFPLEYSYSLCGYALKKAYYKLKEILCSE